MEPSSNKVVLITGGSGELGISVIRSLLKEGNTVINFARKENQAGNYNKSRSLRCRTYEVDVTDHQNVKEAVDKILAEYGRIDVLINNAGVKSFKKISELTHTEWMNVINVNLSGTFYLTKAILPHMMKRNEGLIINIASKAGFYGYASAGAYSASKSGIMRLTEAISKEIEESGVSICALCPSTLATTDITGQFGITGKSRFIKMERIGQAITTIMASPRNYSGRCISIFKLKLRIKLIITQFKTIYYHIVDGFQF